MEKKREKGIRLSVIGIRTALSLILIAVTLILYFCGIRSTGIGSRVASGGNTAEVVRYIVGKYNEFTA